MRTASRSKVSAKSSLSFLSVVPFLFFLFAASLACLSLIQSFSYTHTPFTHTAHTYSMCDGFLSRTYDLSFSNNEKLFSRFIYKIYLFHFFVCVGEIDVGARGSSVLLHCDCPMPVLLVKLNYWYFSSFSLPVLCVCVCAVAGGD